MFEAPSSDRPQGAQPITGIIEKAEKAKKKKDKIRSAWISFVGRILAQLIGATAAIALGFVFLQYQAGGAAAAEKGVAVVSAAPIARGEPDARSLAVLPLENFSADAADDHFGDGVTDAIITTLAQIPSLRVVSRTSSMSYKQGRKSLREIAGELGVRWIVEGSYIRSDGRIRVTAQLIDAKTDRHQWARSYDRTQHDVLALQADLATAIARDLGGALAPEDEQ
jgi:TolB-like protein